MNACKIHGYDGKPLASRGKMLKVARKLIEFDDETKIARAYHVLLEEPDGTIVKYWFNTFQPEDQSEPECVGDRVKFEKNRTTKPITEEKFDKIAKSKGYEDVEEADWPIQCAAVAPVEAPV